LDLLKTLVRRDLESKYKGSILGNFWPLLNQLAQLLIYTYVFSVVLDLKLNLEDLPQTNVGFGLWLFAGLLPWTTFVTGFIQSTSAVVNQPNLVKKVVFPLSLLPIVPIFSTFIESFMGLLVLLLLVAIATQQLPHTIWLLPLVAIPHFLFTAGLGYLSAGLTVFLRDIPQTLNVLMSLWFYLTPIVYPVSLIPERWQQLVLFLNPMAAFSQVYRDLTLVGQVRHVLPWSVAAAVSIIVAYLGYSCYRRLRSAFADVL
jgi:lipopolysaccharide transport system permease protein